MTDRTAPAQPLTDQQLDDIEAKAAELREKTDRKNPWPSDNESFWTTEGWKHGTRNALDKLHTEALVAEVRRLRARLWEHERPATEAERNALRQSFTELAAQASEDGDHEGAFSLECQLREREEQWKAEDAEHCPGFEKQFQTESDAKRRFPNCRHCGQPRTAHFAARPAVPAPAGE